MTSPRFLLDFRLVNVVLFIVKDLEMLTANTELRLNGHTLRVDSFEHELMGTVIEDGGHVEWLKPGLMIFVR